MSKLEFEEYLPNLNIDDIFDRKMEIGALIHFGLLQKIIEEFIKRQKIMNEKINTLENKIESITITQGITESNNNQKKIIEEFPEELIKENINHISKEIILNQKESESNKNTNAVTTEKDITSQRILSSEENKIKQNNNKKEEEKGEEKKIINNLNEINESNDNMNKEEKIKEIKIKELSYRLDKIESINKEIVKRMVSFNNENRNMMQKISDNFEDKIKKITKDIKNLDSKIVENDILSNILKQNQNNNNINNDQLRILIKTLDEKYNKRIDSLEEHNKDNEEQIIKFQREITNLRNLNQANIESSNNIRQNLNKLLNDFNEIKIKNEKEIDDINKIIDEKINNIKNDLLKYSNEQNKKISDFIIEYNSLDKKNNQNKNIDTKILSSLFNEKLENLSTELKHFCSKGLLDTENDLKSMINNLEVDKIRAEIIKIYQELQNKLIKKDLSSIDYKLNEIENQIYVIKSKNDEFENKIENINNENYKNKKMIENLSSQIIKSLQTDPDTPNLIKIYSNELNSFIKKDIYEKEIHKIQKKIEKILEFENENNQYLQVLELKSENYVSEKDLKDLEQYIINEIEEYKNMANKKFLEKKDGQKTFKFLELQIKTLIEKINLNTPISSGDNWLLAKKPLNNYHCASCESYIGDLKNKNEYLPWNKIYPREGPKYRMGQGFSHMLHLINMDLMRSAEKINDDLTIKIEDNKNSKNYFDNNFLHRHNSSKNIRKIKINNKPVNKLAKIKGNKDIRLNQSDFSSEVNTTKYFNSSSIGAKNNSSSDKFNNNKDKKDIFNLKK